MNTESIKEFINYCAVHIKGDEKGEAQTFLDRFFVALGYKDGHKGAGATCEYRIKNDKKRTTSFADLVWKPRVLIEMKKRGERLELHYQQAFSYWMQLVPDRPRYVILCNFEEFWIYDFNNNIYEPLDKIKLVEIEKHKEAFAFLLPKEGKPIFGIDRQDVTKKAANKLAEMFRSLVERGIKKDIALRYTLQCVVSMFAEDIELLPDKIFTRLVNTCSKDKESTYDLIGGLFEAMNKPGKVPHGLYFGVDYFNGGLFEKIDSIELNIHEITQLEFAATHHWTRVNPAIFGTLFENAMGDIERHKAGAHYTNETDIKKIIDPVVVQPWREKIDSASTLNEYYDLIQQLRKYKVLDAACGSGNFLFIAYKEIKIIEKEILERIREKSNKKEDAKRFQQFLLNESYVSTKQFFGIDNKPFAVELAKVTLMVAKELSILEQNEEYDNKDKPLPLDNLNENIICADALFTEWPEVDVIIGNPPFQSKNKMQDEFGKEYLNKLRLVYGEVPGRADFCAYWFYKAHRHLKQGAYAGLVGTNSIRQNYTREGSLDYIVKNGGEIFNAYSSFKWSGEAAVYVSVACWRKGEYNKEKLLYTSDGKDEQFHLHRLARINSSLSPNIDVSSAKVLTCNKIPKKVFQGQTHGHEGFLLEKFEGLKLLKKYPSYSKVLKPFLIGDDLVSSVGAQPSRFVIDFTLYDAVKASTFTELYRIIEKKVLPERKNRAEEQLFDNDEILKKDPKAKVNKHHINFYNNWWKLSYGREDMLLNLNAIKRYISCARVTQRPIFDFFDSSIRPNDKVMVFCFDDYYSFGIIQSTIHWKWFIEKCTTLAETPNYNSAAIWDTFPWPQSPSIKQVQKVAKAAKLFHITRSKLLKETNISLRDLYRVLEKPGKHELKDLQQELDKSVLEAYGFKNAEDGDLLEQLLLLNLHVAEREAKGKVVQAPGIPDWVKNKEDFVTDDCVRFESK